MRIKAYILAGDPNWIEASVLSYYEWVDEILISYDRSRLGWTGHPILVDECLDRLKAIDLGRKLRFLPGEYYRSDYTPMENDTYQRQCAIDAIGISTDWILELDTDEILPCGRTFIECLAQVPHDRMVVDWPMRVFFQRTQTGRFLEVTTYCRKQNSEYAGPVATRPGVRVNNARVSSASKWRFDVRPRGYDPFLRTGYVPDAVIPADKAILHLSWVRRPDDIRRKLQSWGHSKDFDSEKYYTSVWSAAPWKWPFLYNFHPVWPRRWPALKPVRLDSHLVKLTR